jgi:hypothetical protein
VGNNIMVIVSVMPQYQMGYHLCRCTRRYFVCNCLQKPKGISLHKDSMVLSYQLRYITPTTDALQLTYSYVDGNGDAVTFHFRGDFDESCHSTHLSAYVLSRLIARLYSPS